MKNIINKCLSLLFAGLIVFNLFGNAFAATEYNKNNISDYVGKKIIDLNYYHKSKEYYPYSKRLDKRGDLQCVGYAYARLEEKLGLSPDFNSGEGAKDIPDKAPNGATRTALNGQKYKIEVYKNDNGSHITANSFVSFGPKPKGNKYGHVIYVEEVINGIVYYTESGTSIWRSGKAGVLRSKSIKSFVNNCSSGGKYVGTVVFRPVGTSTSSSNTSQQPAASNLNVTLTSYPTSITKGSSYGLRGSVTSNYKITSVKGYIINSSGKTVQSTSETPNSKSMDIRYSKINNNLVFGNLSAGNYTLKVVAKDAYGKEKTWSTSFTVKAPASVSKNPNSTLKVELTSYPTSIAKGKSYGLRGSVTSNYKISWVKGYILNSNGKIVQDTLDTPNATSMDIRYAKVNNNLLFNKLAKGTYTLKVVARDTYGKEVTWSKQFKVK